MKLKPFGIVLVCVISYLTYHAIAGKQGLSEWTAMQARTLELEEAYQDRLEHYSELKDQITRLYPETLDDDYLEELARTKFHFVYPAEFVLEPPGQVSQLPENEDLFDLQN